MKGIKIWTNIKMRTDIKYIPALGSSAVKKDVLKEEYPCSNVARKIKLDNYEKMKKRSNLYTVAL